MSVSGVSYHAEWNASNQHLNPENHSVTKRVYEFVSYYGLWIPHQIAKIGILPASRMYLEMDDFTHESYQNQRLILETPDGVQIDATHFQTNRTQDRTIPTIILFNPNCCIYNQGVFSWLLDEMANSERPCNFVMFDYRGTGDSRGDVTHDGLIIDGETVYNYVQDQLGVPENNIGFYGWSLGGAISAQVKALHPEGGAIVSDRSFSTFFDIAYEMSQSILSNFLPSFIAKPIAYIAAWLGYLSGWEYDSIAAWAKINGEKLAICHLDDPVIKFRASLYQSQFRENYDINAELGDSIVTETPIGNPHCELPTNLYTQEWLGGERVSHIVQRFFARHLGN